MATPYPASKLAFKVCRTTRAGIVKYPTGRNAVEWNGATIDFNNKKGLFHKGCWEDYHERNKKKPAVKQLRFLLPKDTSKPESNISSMFVGNNYTFVVYTSSGAVYHSGKVENRQRIGEWVEYGVKTYYLQGVQVDYRLWSTPAEQLDSREIMAIENVQLRTALCTKRGYERILKDMEGKVIDTAGDYALYELPILKPVTPRWQGQEVDKVIRLLKVRCPSTGAYYTLRVPPNIDKVEDARQWTFRVPAQQDDTGRLKVENPITFTQET
jgi:hypothetical protein